MTNDTPDNTGDTWSDDEMKEKLEGALGKNDLQESAVDPFATDGLGHKPAKEDDSGSDG